MHKSTWKQLERNAAKLLTEITGIFTQRTRGSGSNNQRVDGVNVTRSDTNHPLVYCECKKTSKELSFYSVWKDASTKAQVEKKIPMVILSTTKHRGMFVVLEAADLKKLIDAS